jgi:uncharacterized membrane protein
MDPRDIEMLMIGMLVGVVLAVLALLIVASVSVYLGG